MSSKNHGLALSFWHAPLGVWSASVSRVDWGYRGGSPTAVQA